MDKPLFRLRADQKVWRRWTRDEVTIPAGTTVEIFDRHGDLATVMPVEGVFVGLDFVVSIADLVSR